MRIPSRSIATLLMAVGVATCSDSPTAPLRHTGGANGKAGFGRVAFSPVFSTTAAATYARMADFGISFDSVRVVLRDYPDTTRTVKDTTVAFTPSSSDLPLDLT